jgi:adiponectin receptor
LTVESYEDINTAKTTGKEEQKPIYKRRHSSFHPRRRSSDYATMDGDEGLLLRVHFLLLAILESDG